MFTLIEDTVIGSAAETRAVKKSSEGETKGGRRKKEGRGSDDRGE